VEKFFARNLAGLSHARTRAGPAREGTSYPPSTHADEKSDVVPSKPPMTFRGGRGGKGPHPREQPAGGRGSNTAPSRHVEPIDGYASDRPRPQAASRPALGPRERCLSSALRDLCGGPGAILVATATIACVLSVCPLSGLCAPENVLIQINGRQPNSGTEPTYG